MRGGGNEFTVLKQNHDSLRTWSPKTVTVSEDTSQLSWPSKYGGIKTIKIASADYNENHLIINTTIIDKITNRSIGNKTYKFKHDDTALPDHTLSDLYYKIK